MQGPTLPPVPRAWATTYGVKVGRSWTRPRTKGRNGDPQRKRTGKIPIKKSIDNSNKWVLNKQQRGRCSGEANEWLIGSIAWKRKDIQIKASETPVYRKT